MAPMQGSFDATQFKPQQGIGSHPVGKFPASISNTTIESTKDNTGGMFIVEFTTQGGSIIQRYNLWNASAKAVEIAHGQLSALCHATGIFRLDWSNDGASLRNARCQIEVGYQKGEEPTQEKPAGGYVEVKKVFDINGNEPGRPPVNAPQVQPQQPQPQPQPMTQQPGGTWAPPAQQINPSQQQTNPAPQQAPQQWGGPAPQPQAPQAGNWQQGPTTQSPPWQQR